MGSGEESITEYELDRVTLVDYPDDTLDIATTYDDPAIAFSRGRLTEILCDGHGVDYEYDRFGQVTGDGDLSYVYDDNGKRLEIGHPGGVKAHYTDDFADRQAILDVELPGEPLQAIVIFARYYPSGPLKGLIFSSGISETREHDRRYYPSRIVVAKGRNTAGAVCPCHPRP